MDDSFAIIVYGVRSFANTLIAGNERVEFVNRNFETERISGVDLSRRGGWRVFVSNDGRSLFFTTSSDALVRIDPTKRDGDRTEIARDVENFVVSSDGKTVYYINDDEELWYVSGNGRPSKVADFVEPYRLTISGNNAFFLVDYNDRRGGDLCFSSNGRASVRIANDVISVWSTPAGVFYRTYDGDTYRSNGNDKFSFFHAALAPVRTPSSTPGGTTTPSPR